MPGQNHSEFPRNNPAVPDSTAGEEPTLRPPALLHPAVFVGAFVALGTIFALQEWMNFRRWGYHIHPAIEFESWGVEFLIWGIVCWLMGRFLQKFIARASGARLVLVMLPLSVCASIVVEMIYVTCFPHLPLNRPRMPWGTRLAFQFDADLADNLVIFWAAFLVFRGAAYYQQLRERELKAARLEAQLSEARVAALRMQLNPHFLFNAMNSISGMMRVDVNAADSMLEQLSSLMRLTLERGDAQVISLREEIEFIELYLDMQKHRYGSRMQQSFSIPAVLHDAQVPALILQPLVENAFVHGVAKSAGPVRLRIEARSEQGHLRLSVVNGGIGLSPQSSLAMRRGIGLANVRDRLRLLYGEEGSLAIREIAQGQVHVMVQMPLRLVASDAEPFARFGL
jgi:two-component system LytT family sensor kinase